MLIYPPNYYEQDYEPEFECCECLDLGYTGEYEICKHCCMEQDIEDLEFLE